MKLLENEAFNQEFILVPDISCMVLTCLFQSDHESYPCCGEWA
jgi:hypothetical protein